MKELRQRDFKNKSLFIATPCYGGSARVEYIRSMMSLVSSLNFYKIPYKILLLQGQSLIVHARNELAARFMASGLTHLMFIDADQEFNEKDVIRMLYYDKDVLCAGVPQKVMPPKYVVRFVKETDDKGTAFFQVDDYFYELEAGGTGFMMIKREVFLKMFKKYPELKYMPSFASLTEDPENTEHRDIAKISKKLIDNTYALFDCILAAPESDGVIRHTGEDYGFCLRWKKMGGQILLDPEIIVNHIGHWKFKGHSLETLVHQKSELDKEAKKIDN